MNRLLFIICSFSLLFCNRKEHSSSQPSASNKTIYLIDSLGSISIAIPTGTDTFFTWIRRNDCGKPCEEGKYRFQPKRLPIFKESGFFWLGQPEDSVNQLTISHHRPDMLVLNDDSFAIKHCTYFKERLEYDMETTNIIFDTTQKIGDRHFCIFKIADVDKKKGILIRRVVAFTSISGNILQFRYDLLTQNRDSLLKHFFDNAMRNLETVRLYDHQ